MQQITTHSEEETILAGVEFSRLLIPGSVVALEGDLGTGKTHFTKGISRGLEIADNVTSPTFTIVNEHRGGRLPLYHFDCYRLRTPAELDELGFDEYIYGSGVCVIEWAELIESRLPEHRFNVRLTLGNNETERTIIITQQ
ncbi:MAG: tRNA (adenosine(37)-N6)-threonylcarbamoyltransferase complex ATPase subunit type 1 TsaE [Bacteroidota bacterium]